jgi:hypothetical protein
MPAMPCIYRWPGVRIAVYSRKIRRYRAPHFHVTCAEYTASIAIGTEQVFEGDLPPRQMRGAGLDRDPSHRAAETTQLNGRSSHWPVRLVVASNGRNAASESPPSEEHSMSPPQSESFVVTCQCELVRPTENVVTQ